MYMPTQHHLVLLSESETSTFCCLGLKYMRNLYENLVFKHKTFSREYSWMKWCNKLGAIFYHYITAWNHIDGFLTKIFGKRGWKAWATVPSSDCSFSSKNKGEWYNCILCEVRKYKYYVLTYGSILTQVFNSQLESLKEHKFYLKSWPKTISEVIHPV